MFRADQDGNSGLLGDKDLTVVDSREAKFAWSVRASCPTTIEKSTRGQVRQGRYPSAAELMPSHLMLYPFALYPPTCLFPQDRFHEVDGPFTGNRRPPQIGEGSDAEPPMSMDAKSGRHILDTRRKFLFDIYLGGEEAQ